MWSSLGNCITDNNATNATDVFDISARILRPLAAIGFVNEVGEQTWEATPLTEVMAEKEISAGFRMVYVLNHHSQWPSFSLAIDERLTPH